MKATRSYASLPLFLAAALVLSLGLTQETQGQNPSQLSPAEKPTGFVQHLVKVARLDPGKYRALVLQYEIGRALDELKGQGFWLVGADPDAPDALYQLSDRVLQGDLVVVLGAEGRGLRPSVRAALDHPVRIPMLGHVASMNVATAGAVILFELLRRSQS